MRKWRVGTVSMGLLLVATGVLLLGSELYGYSGAMLILRWWPAILIILGVEILAYVLLSQDDQPKIKFDGLSIFLTILIVLISTGVYATHSFMKSDLPIKFFDEVGFYKHETLLTKSYALEADEVESLKVENQHGDINIESYDGTTIKIDAYILVKSNDELAAANIGENILEITEAKNTTIKSKYESLLLTGSKQQVTVNYYVKVPKELTYDIENRFGDIILADLTGNIEVKGRSGRVEIENVQGDLRVNNSHGDIRIVNTTGKAVINNDHGSISYSNEKTVSDDISLRSRYGTIVAELAETQQGTFKAQTSFGQIRVEGISDNPPKEIEENKRVWEEKIGADSPRIDVEAEHGDVTITTF